MLCKTLKDISSEAETYPHLLGTFSIWDVSEVALRRSDLKTVLYKYLDGLS